MTRDYYEVLGIDRSASLYEVRKQYIRLAFKFHPDRNPGDDSALERFKKINEAYQILSDENKRAQYDSLFSRSDSGSNTNESTDDFNQTAEPRDPSGSNTDESMDGSNLFRFLKFLFLLPLLYLVAVIIGKVLIVLIGYLSLIVLIGCLFVVVIYFLFC